MSGGCKCGVVGQKKYRTLKSRCPRSIGSVRLLKGLNQLLLRKDELKAELIHQQTLLKQLRQQILQEAIEGKLTTDWRAQNPDVEPASELLKRIAAEKAQLVKDKKIKAQKPLPPIMDEEKPFEIPQGWMCAYP